MRNVQQCRHLGSTTFWTVPGEDEDKGIPIWVARHCHGLGSGQLTVNGITGTEKAKPGDAILNLETTVLLIPRDEFEKDYEVVT